MSPLARVSIAFVAVLSACGTSKPSSEGTSDAPPASGLATAPPASDASTPTTGDAKAEQWRSPLDTFLGYGDKGQRTAEDEARDEADARQLEQLIATCMQDQGFHYVPRDPSQSSGKDTGPWSLPPEQFAHQYGYGITTIDKRQIAGNDPNQQLVDAMTIPERRAYYHALYGEVITVDDNGNLTKQRPKDGQPPDPSGSCSAQASETVYGKQEQPATHDTVSDPFTALEQEIGALYDRENTDPRVADATTAWSSCMADAGFPGFTDINDPMTEVDSRARTVMGNDNDPATADPAKLQELRQYEVSVASADFECHKAYDAVHQQVQTEIEQQFIDEHRAELEQYRDAIAAGTVGKG